MYCINQKKKKGIEKLPVCLVYHTLIQMKKKKIPTIDSLLTNVCTYKLDRTGKSYKRQYKELNTQHPTVYRRK